ncbi:MAG: hypothetical protein K8R92_10990 [Planctomycetes bacterium]|nr:hypothetical protein [Planctomycetota bacterium]
MPSSFALVVALAASSSCFAAVVVSDGTFNDADWSMTTFQFGPYGGGGSASQTAGGVPESCRMVTNSCGNDYSGAWNLSMLETFSYNPSSGGALTDLTFSMDSRYVDGLQAMSFVVEQDNHFWRVGYFINTESWTTYAIAPVAADFYAMDLDTPALPDFSATGGVIRFGFGSANSSTSWGYSRTGLYDNFVVNFVPSPAGLTIAGAVGLLRGRRRR